MAPLLYGDVVVISFDDALQATLLDLQTLGFTATAWQPFSTPALYCNLTALFRSAVSEYAVFFKEIFIVETSYGEGLTREVRSFYAITRNPAVEAQLAIELSCGASNGPYTINIGALTFVHPNGSTYRNVAGLSVTYPATLATGGTLTLLCEAEIGGTKANVANANVEADVTVALQTTLAGVKVISHVLERSGLDEEDDVRLTERAQLKWSRNLPKLGLIDDGIKASALEAAPAVTSVEVDSTNPRGPATFNVWIAGLDATASDDDVVKVQTAIDVQTMGRNALTKTCMVYKAPTETLDVSGLVFFSGTSVAIVQQAVEAALLDFVRKTPLGGFKYYPGPTNVVPKNDIESVIRTAVQSVASQNTTVVLTEPASDFSVALHQKVLRGDWSGLVYQVINP